jgi:hypothetical protein
VIDRTIVSHTIHPVRSSSSSEHSAFSLGMAAMQRLGAICLEQDRMREQIISETCSVLGAAVKRAADSLNGIQSDGDCRHSVKTVGQVVIGFRRHSVSSSEHSSVACRRNCAASLAIEHPLFVSTDSKFLSSSPVTFL